MSQTGDTTGTIRRTSHGRPLIAFDTLISRTPSPVCFDFFDVDGSGTIDEKEFIELCKTVNNAAPMFPGNFANAIEMFDV